MKNKFSLLVSMLLTSNIAVSIDQERQDELMKNLTTAEEEFEADYIANLSKPYESENTVNQIEKKETKPVVCNETKRIEVEEFASPREFGVSTQVLFPLINSSGVLVTASNSSISLFDTKSLTGKERKLQHPFVFSSPLELPNKKIAIGTKDGYLLILNEDGSLFKETKLGDAVITTPALTKQGDIAIGAINGTMNIIDSVGKVKVSKMADSAIKASPLTLKDGRVIFISEKGTIYSFDPLKPDQMNTLLLKEKVLASPFVTRDGGLIVISEKGKLYDIDINEKLLKVSLENCSFHSKESSASDMAKLQTSPVILKDQSIVVNSGNGKVSFLKDESGQVQSSKKRYKVKATYQLDGEIVSFTSLKDGSVAVSTTSPSGMHIIRSDGTLVGEIELDDKTMISTEELPDNKLLLMGLEGLYLVDRNKSRKVVLNKLTEIPCPQPVVETESDVKEITEIKRTKTK